jgi:hypothetical protein
MDQDESTTGIGMMLWDLRLDRWEVSLIIVCFWVFVIKEGAEKDMCCGLVGSNISRFCMSVPNECTFKSHIKKNTSVKARHVYLGTYSGKKSAGWTSWCMPVEVFGGREAQLSALGLDGPQIRHFGEMLEGLYAGKKIEMRSVLWDTILNEITQPLDYAGTPRKVQFRTQHEAANISTGLRNWMPFVLTPQGPTQKLREEEEVSNGLVIV